MTKVALNQLCLAPVVIAGVFAWNLAMQGQLVEWPRKAQADFMPTLLNGWKFWVPAASINFTLVPLQQQVCARGGGAGRWCAVVAQEADALLLARAAQVLYMSCCGVLWTGYLSFSSAQKR